MTFKRTLLLATALMMSATLAPAEQGGNDPIPGIDIIVKKNPGSKPIRPLTLSDKQLDKLGDIKGEASARYMAEIIAKHIAGSGGGGKVAVRDLTATFLEYGCPPMPWSHCGMEINVKGDEAKYSIRIRPRDEK